MTIKKNNSLPPPSHARNPVHHVRRIMFVAVPPIEEIDLFGPVSAFLGANRCAGHASQPTPPYRVDIVAGTAALNVAGQSGIGLLTGQSYSQVSGAVDTLVVISGRETGTAHEPGLLSWLRDMTQHTRRIVSVCTGAFLLAEAGLLDRRRATTHWALAASLATRFPEVKLEPDSIWVRDGNVYTSAGVTAGIDLALALIEDDLGAATALEVARGMVVFLHRPGGQAQFSVTMTSRRPGSRPLRQLQVWMLENLSKDLSVERLADQVAMSPRHFARVFKQETGITPARYVQSLRLERARQMLEENAWSMERIAAACGYGETQLMRRALQRELGITPGEYRERFHTKKGKK
ncbi:GlxA family transcriptional regulator [Paraherbaspirillum soli]|uniref:GlxA family transcriptional regulator n=1 Tax=Paraherbaspirillum soli TaxID=631222 RepID=A0ABW0M6S9_9BURK